MLKNTVTWKTINYQLQNCDLPVTCQQPQASSAKVTATLQLVMLKHAASQVAEDAVMPRGWTCSARTPVLTALDHQKVPHSKEQQSEPLVHMVASLGTSSQDN